MKHRDCFGSKCTNWGKKNVCPGYDEFQLQIAFAYDTVVHKIDGMLDNPELKPPYKLNKGDLQAIKAYYDFNR